MDVLKVFLLLSFSNLLEVLVELRIGLPLPFDDQEEDAGGDAEDDGEHGDYGGEDDLVQHGGGGPAVARHLGHRWSSERKIITLFSQIGGHRPDLVSLSWPHTEVELCRTGGRYRRG